MASMGNTDILSENRFMSILESHIVAALPGELTWFLDSLWLGQSRCIDCFDNSLLQFGDNFA
ncbi:hypothetical protein PanABDRAFT_4254 [Pantoea sp. aB]|jgi:hypothetical protein|nr:hypothetical protein PanABDRAFT_4254 [Pantoea sp. aB]